MQYLIIPFFAFLNRARGSLLFGKTDSTIEARIVSMLCMSLALAAGHSDDIGKLVEILVTSFALLMLWASPAWDRYWQAAIASISLNPSGFAPVDWIMARIWTPPAWIGSTTNWKLRFWGLTAMALRMTLAAPWVVALAFLAGHPENAWLAVFTPLLAIPYFVWGLLFHYWSKFDAYTITLSELSVGAGLGALAIFALS